MLKFDSRVVITKIHKRPIFPTSPPLFGPPADAHPETKCLLMCLVVKKPPISTLTPTVIFYDIPLEVLSLILVTASAICQGVSSPLSSFLLRHHLSEKGEV